MPEARQRFHTSDHHFQHLRIADLASRPWQGRDVSEGDAALVAAWTSVVGPDDDVIHYGDLLMGDFEAGLALIASLPGNKRLVPGNHDRVFSKNKRRQRYLDAYTEAGFEVLDEQIELALFDERTGRTVRALGCHFPYDGDSRESARYADLRPIDQGVPLVHGHVHAAWLMHRTPRGTPMLNVGVDAPSAGLAPMSEQRVVDLLLGREIV